MFFRRVNYDSLTRVFIISIHVRVMANLKRPRETFLSCKLKEKAWEDHPAKKRKLSAYHHDLYLYVDKACVRVRVCVCVCVCVTCKVCVCCVCGFVVISIDTLLSFPERLKVVCIETNKMHDVLSTALETDDRDYVTEEDLTVGNQLVWQKKKERVTVRVAQRGNNHFHLRNINLHHFICLSRCVC